MILNSDAAMLPRSVKNKHPIDHAKRIELLGPENGPVVGGVLTTFPFLNAVCDITFSGQQWLNIFEGIASRLVDLPSTSTRIIPL